MAGMSRAAFNKQFGVLLSAFAYAVEKINPDTEEVYWQVLKDLPEDRFGEGVLKAIGESKWFPTVAELLEKIFPPFDRLPEYNPWGNPNEKPKRISPMQQFIEYRREQQKQPELPVQGRKKLAFGGGRQGG